MTLLNRRLGALLALIALLAFVSGAGLDAPSIVPAAAVLLLAVWVQPGERAARWLEPLWRTAALLLAVRAAVTVAYSGADPVLPMVDLLLLLLCAESLRVRDGSGDARHFALTFALLIAAAAYRPGPLFGLLFVAYVVCAILVLTVGHLTRQSLAHGTRPPAPNRPFLLRLGMLSFVVIAVSGLVFLFFPRVSQGWAARAQTTVSGVSVGFSDRVSIGDHGATIEANPEVVLRVEFPGGAPPNVTSLHWRGRAYDTFDGTAWSRSDRAPVRLLEAQRWDLPPIEQLVFARPLGGANVIFGLHPIATVRPESRIRPVRTAGGDYLYFGEVDPVYRVQSLLGTPPADSLRRVRMVYPPSILPQLQLPPPQRDGAVQRWVIDPATGIRERLDDAAAALRSRTPGSVITARTLALADSFRAASGNVYDHAAAIEEWLRTEFDYTLQLPATPAQATLDHFLFERRAGHCEYFSTAMAVLLRAGGVPARNVNGFLGGDWNEFGGFLTVTQNNAHSWVEVWFPGWGWVPFDPTPAGGASGVAVQQRGFAPLRFFFDGLEHRWGKWVLDYDLGTQSALVERFRAPFSQPEPAPGPGVTSDDGSRVLGPALIALIAIGLAVVLLRRTRFGRRGRVRAAGATRAYLKLRGAFARLGYPPAREMGPLAFAGAVGSAPGGVHARRAVELYALARFGGAELSREGEAELRESVAEALRATRNAGRREAGNGVGNAGTAGTA